MHTFGVPAACGRVDCCHPAAHADRFTQEADVVYSFVFAFCQKLLYTVASGDDCMDE